MLTAEKNIIQNKGFKILAKFWLNVRPVEGVLSTNLEDNLTCFM